MNNNFSLEDPKLASQIGVLMFIMIPHVKVPDYFPRALPSRNNSPSGS